MTDKKLIAKLKKRLEYKDTMEISRRSGYSTVTVSGFFNGKRMRAETERNILEAAAELLKERGTKEQAITETLETLLAQP